MSNSPSSRTKLIIAFAVLLSAIGAALIVQLHRSPAASEEADATLPAKSRAVFGGSPEGSPEAPTAEAKNDGARYRSESPLATTRGIAAKGGIGGDVPPDIRQFLESWRSSLLQGDLNTHVSLYTSRVERFFRRRNVTREAVRREKELVLSKYPNIEQYDIRDVKVDRVSDSRASVTFRKDWDMRGRRRFAGSEIQRLMVRKDAGKWQITGEEELKVFRVQR